MQELVFNPQCIGIYALDQGWQTFSIKDQINNIVVFAGHRASVITTHLQVE